MVKTFGNIIWLILGGIFMAFGYLIAGVLACVFVVTIPLAPAAFRFASYTLWPFGRTIVDNPRAGAGKGIANIIWAIVAGWWLALGHLFSALLCAITIIGIPFAVIHGRLAVAAFAPFGKEICSTEEAERRRIYGRGTPAAVVMGPGWYPDPHRPGGQRWWDGARWTDSTS